jgi:hypothetical protein
MEVFSIINEYPNYAVSTFGKVINIKTGREIKPALSKGHLILTLYNENGSKQKYIHRLMGEIFLDNPNNLPFVDHRNQNPLDNNINNLRWSSISQNTRNTNKKPRGNITKVELKGGGYSWRVCVGKNGVRHRKNLPTEQEAKKYLAKWIEENDKDIL